MTSRSLFQPKYSIISIQQKSLTQAVFKTLHLPSTWQAILVCLLNLKLCSPYWIKKSELTSTISEQFLQFYAIFCAFWLIGFQILYGCVSPQCLVPFEAVPTQLLSSWLLSLFPLPKLLKLNRNKSPLFVCRYFFLPTIGPSFPYLEDDFPGQLLRARAPR